MQLPHSSRKAQFGGAQAYIVSFIILAVIVLLGAVINSSIQSGNAGTSTNNAVVAASLGTVLKDVPINLNTPVVASTVVVYNTSNNVIVGSGNYTIVTGSFDPVGGFTQGTFTLTTTSPYNNTALSANYSYSTFGSATYNITGNGNAGLSNFSSFLSTFMIIGAAILVLTLITAIGAGLRK